MSTYIITGLSLKEFNEWYEENNDSIISWESTALINGLKTVWIKLLNKDILEIRVTVFKSILEKKVEINSMDDLDDYEQLITQREASFGMH